MLSHRTKTSLTIVTIIIFVIGLHVLGWLRPLEEFLRRIINPASQSMFQLSISLEDEVHLFSSSQELQEKYKNLYQKYKDAAVDEAKVQLLEQENKELREQLQFFTSSSFQHVGAAVIGKNIEPLSSSIVINKGTADGIIQDDPVIVGKGIFIGIVIRANEHTSVVRLIDDTQSKVGATLLNKEKSIGLIEGGYGVSVKMSFIPQNERIQVGDMIVTSGLSENIPRGLLIGTIESVQKEAYQPFQEATVTPAADLEKVFLVSVLVS